MQFISNGPDVPEELLQAHEDGKVVFFCGAGISYPAQLPGFGGLVDGIYKELGEIPDAVEEIALASNSYDTAIGLLEKRVVGHRQQVRKAIAKILTPNLRKRDATTTHKAILELSRTDDGHIRLITTNFDRLFVEAMRRMRVAYPSYCAPLLPVPKKAKWDGLVYLHGMLPKVSSSGDLERLIVSSGDFGLAYLTERWAARFVSELFRGYTVCFVGYSIDDPVLRYMMDALAADRLIGEKSPDAYAFGGHKLGDEVHTNNVWTAKNVRPILYSEAGGHSLLHKTLAAWANSYRDGVRGKESIVTRHARSMPQGSTKQDNFVGRMLWAISDKSGLPAKLFADLDPPPPIEWLEEFDKAAFAHSDLIRFQVTPHPDHDDKLKFSLLNRPWPYHKAPWMRLVFRKHNVIGHADNVMIHTGRWLVKHLNDPRALLWISKRGSIPVDNLAFMIGDALEKIPGVVSPEMEAYWRLLLAGRLQDTSSNSDLYTFQRDLRRAGRVTSILRMRLRDVLLPRIKISEGYRSSDDRAKDGDRPTIDWELAIGGTHSGPALREIFKSDAWQGSLPELASDATSLLFEAMELAGIVGGASAAKDRSYYQQPSIAPHSQNRSFRDWTVIIDFTRDAWLAAADSSPLAAIREFERWGEFSYPIFRRLQLFALAQHLPLFGGTKAVDLLLSDDCRWMWSVETQREALQLIAVIAKKLSIADSTRLLSAIVDRSAQSRDRVEAEPHRIDRDIWKRLGIYQEGGGHLTANAIEKWSYLEDAHPQWGAVTERDQFPFFFESGGLERDYKIAPFERLELKEWLKEHPTSGNFDENDDFLERCRIDFPRTVIALLDLANEGHWIVDRWREALQAWSSDTRVERSWRCVGPRLLNAPDNVLHDLRYPISNWLQACGKIAASRQASYFPLVRRMFNVLSRDIYQDSEGFEGSDLNAALNHPIGQISDGLLKLWFAQELNDGQLIQPEFKSLFTIICDSTFTNFAHGRLFLCTNAIALYRVDPAWTSRNLLILFDWEISTREAKTAWTGFLWSPRLYVPLLRHLKREFLATAGHYSDLPDICEHYAGLLTFAALDTVDGFAPADFAKATRLLPEEGLVQCLQTVTEGLEGAGTKVGEYWDNRVKSYLHYVWPKSQELLTERVSAAFAKLLVATGEKFPEAFDVLKDFLQHTDEADFVLHKLAESELASKFPDTAVQFLGRVGGAGRAWDVGPLSQCIEQILGAEPMLKSSKIVKKLQQGL